jgi:hypothetical protein
MTFHEGIPTSKGSSPDMLDWESSHVTPVSKPVRPTLPMLGLMQAKPWANFPLSRCSSKLALNWPLSTSDKTIPNQSSGVTLSFVLSHTRF